MADIIQERQDMRVLEIKDYITHMKESGYRSYHMIIAYHVETLEGPREIKAEIQIRTLAMNFGQRLNIRCSINIKEICRLM